MAQISEYLYLLKQSNKESFCILLLSVKVNMKKFLVAMLRYNLYSMSVGLFITVIIVCNFDILSSLHKKYHTL